METLNQNKVIRISSFEEMKKYAGNSPWCLADSEKIFNSYNGLYDNIYIIESSKTKDPNFSTCCLLISKDITSRLIGQDNVEHYQTDKDWDELLYSILTDEEYNRFKVSEILHYLTDIGWTELIDSRWKDDVILDIKQEFPNVSDEIINEILRVVLI